MKSFTATGNSPQRLFEYNAVRNAFENAGRKGALQLDRETPDKETYILDGKPLQLITAKHFRHLLTPVSTPCANNFWKRKLNVELNDKVWSLVHQATKETRLRVLHWKILHNIYPTNILLKKMGLAPSENCSVCDSGDKDYIELFFFHCSKVTELWVKTEAEI